MGLTNWALNRANPSGRSSVTVCANSPYSLDNEVMKFERKGYVRVGNPYTVHERGPLRPPTFYQAMSLSAEVIERAQEEKKAKEEAKKAEKERRQAIEDAKTPEQKAKDKEKNLAKIKLAGSVALGPFGLISKKNRENIKDSVNKLLDK